MRPIVFVALSLFSINLAAQVKVTSLGNLGIGTSNPVSKIAVNDSGNARFTLFVRNPGTQVAPYAILSTITTPPPGNTNNGYSVIYSGLNAGNGVARAIVGQSQNSTPQYSGRAYGIYGIAANATPGYNYAVMGKLLGSNNGAAIYGAVGGFQDDIEDDTQGRFAGYFKGNTYVSNFLSVGNISPSYSVDVTGSVRAFSFITASDEKLKNNIKKIDNDKISKLTKLRGVTYNYKKTSNSIQAKSAMSADTIQNVLVEEGKDSSYYTKNRVGFIAQEVKELYPDLVYSDKDETLAIDYTGFIPLIIETLKKQEEVIANQSVEIGELKRKIDVLNNSSSTSKNTINILYQNSPNPFVQNTTIQYYLSETAKSATMYIYTVQGDVADKFVVSNAMGLNTVNYSSSLKPGIYTYLLLVDGIESGTKRMIISN